MTVRGELRERAGPVDGGTGPAGIVEDFEGECAGGGRQERIHAGVGDAVAADGSVALRSAAGSQ